MRATRGIAARYIKANSSRKGSRPLFPGPFPVRDTFSKIGVPTEEQAKAHIATCANSLAAASALTEFNEEFASTRGSKLFG